MELFVQEFQLIELEEMAEGIWGLNHEEQNGLIYLIWGEVYDYMESNIGINEYNNLLCEMISSYIVSNLLRHKCQRSYEGDFVLNCINFQEEILEK